MIPDTAFLRASSQDGLLHTCEEEIIVTRGDWLNGKRIIRCGGDYSKCEMQVIFVNGKEDREALILYDDVPYFKLEYRNGLPTTGVERADQCGVCKLMVGFLREI